MSACLFLLRTQWHRRCICASILNRWHPARMQLSAELTSVVASLHLAVQAVSQTPIVPLDATFPRRRQPGIETRLLIAGYVVLSDRNYSLAIEYLPRFRVCWVEFGACRNGTFAHMDCYTSCLADAALHRQIVMPRHPDDLALLEHTLTIRMSPSIGDSWTCLSFTDAREAALWHRLASAPCDELSRVRNLAEEATHISRIHSDSLRNLNNITGSLLPALPDRQLSTEPGKPMGAIAIAARAEDARIEQLLPECRQFDAEAYAATSSSIVFTKTPTQMFCHG